MAERLEHPKEGGVAALTVIGTAVHALLLVGLLAALVIEVPRFREIFLSFGTDLPAVTALLIDLACYARQFWFLLLPVLGALIAADGWVFYSLYRARRTAWAWAWWMLILLLLLMASWALVVGLFLPLYELLTQVGQSAGQP